MGHVRFPLAGLFGRRKIPLRQAQGLRSLERLFRPRRLGSSRFLGTARGPRPPRRQFPAGLVARWGKRNWRLSLRLRRAGFARWACWPNLPKQRRMVGEVGLEPTKAKPADLQSAPFAARDTLPFAWKPRHGERLSEPSLRPARISVGGGLWEAVPRVSMGKPPRQRHPGAQLGDARQALANWR